MNDLDLSVRGQEKLQKNSNPISEFMKVYAFILSIDHLKT